MDRNLLHISYEAGILEDPWFDPTTRENQGMFKLSVSPEDAPNRPEYVELEFVRGNCVAVNGKKLTPAGVLKTLNALGGTARHRSRRPGREPLRRHEVPRRLRDSGRHDPACTATGRSSR